MCCNARFADKGKPGNPCYCSSGKMEETSRVGYAFSLMRSIFHFSEPLDYFAVESKYEEESVGTSEL